MRLLIFLLQDKVRKEKKIELPAEKSHNFLKRGIKRIRRKVLWEDYLTTVSPNFSQFGLGAADLEFKMHVQLADFLLSKNRENIGKLENTECRNAGMPESPESPESSE